MTLLHDKFWFAAGVFALSCAAAPAEAGGASAATDSPRWLAPLAGAKLVAVDGSTMTLSPSEGGFALALAAPNGAAQRSTFAFMSDKLGTISDDADTGHVIGFFRETDTGVEAQFADGKTESLVVNTAGGISLTMHAAAGDASCVAWYPSDHVFGAAEKRAALAAYADRLGLADHSKKAPRAPQSCAPAAHIAKAQTPPPASGPYKIGMYQGAAVTGSGAAGLTQIAVRTSEVHTIDAAVAAPLAAIPPPAAATQPAAPVVSQSVPPALAPIASKAPAQVTLASAVPDGHGASDCLAIESDGANIGFRNHCAYGVQFAYCLQKSSDPAADCGAGAKAGAVSANSFALLLTDTNIKSADAERDFRWVACSGSNGSIVAHLDRADPPVGHCAHADAS